MGSLKITAMIFITIAIALLLLSSATDARETKLVKEVCKEVYKVSHAPYKDCVQALTNDFRTDSIKDIRELTFLSLDLAMANSSEAVGFVRGMAENSPAALRPVLESCFRSLNNSYGNFHVAVGDIMVDVMTGNYDVFVAMDAVNECRQVMKSAGVRIPAVSSRCDYVELFVLICYTTTSMLQRRGG